MTLASSRPERGSPAGTISPVAGDSLRVFRLLLLLLLQLALT